MEYIRWDIVEFCSSLLKIKENYLFNIVRIYVLVSVNSFMLCDVNNFFYILLLF